MSAIIHTIAESQAYLSFPSWDIPGHPGMSAIIHATAVSYVSFPSWGIPGHPGMSAIIHATAIMCFFHPGISQGIPGCQPSSTLQLLCVLSILGHPRMSAIIHTTAESQAYVSFSSQDVSHHPCYTAGSQAYVPFISWDIPGHSRMSFIPVKLFKEP